jgi:PilZ domain
MSARDTAALNAAENAAREGDAREERRRQLLWSGMLQTAQGPSPCVVVDISRGGAHVARAPSVAVGQSVTLKVRGLGMFRGKVVWCDTGDLGIAFAT